MRNICFFNSINFWGGGEKLHLEYALEFIDKQYHVILVSHPNSPLWQKAQAAQVKVYPIKASGLSFLNPLKLKYLKNFFRKQNIDTVIFTTSQDAKLGGLAAKAAGVKKIVYLRGLAAPIKNSFINRYLFKHVLTHVVANSEATKKQIVAHLSPQSIRANVNTIYHGIDIQVPDGETLTDIRLKGKGIILGNAGRLTHQKGQEHLLDLAQILVEKKLNFTLFIAGTGELHQELKNDIKKRQLEAHVILLGFVSNMKAFYQSIDVFLLSSLWEGFGYVLAEAMCFQVPIVAFRLSSNPELVNHDVNGFLVDYPNIQQFADYVILLSENKETREKMGKNGLNHVVMNFERKAKVDEFEKFLLKENLL